MPLVAADEVPTQIPLEAHGSLSIVVRDEDNLFLPLAHPCLPSRLSCPLPRPNPVPLQLFPRNGWTALQTKLLSPLASLYMSDEIRFKPGSALCSADSNQIKISVMWDMIRSIFTLLSPLMVLSSGARGRVQGEPMKQNCFSG